MIIDTSCPHCGREIKPGEPSAVWWIDGGPSNDNPAPEADVHLSCIPKPTPEGHIYQICGSSQETLRALLVHRFGYVKTYRHVLENDLNATVDEPTVSVIYGAEGFYFVRCIDGSVMIEERTDKRRANYAAIDVDGVNDWLDQLLGEAPRLDVAQF